MRTTYRQQPIEVGALAKRGVGALAIALVVNLALGWIALTADLVGSTEFFRYPAIALWTTLGIAGATGVYGAVTRVSNSPDPTFVRLAGAVLVLSMLPNIGLIVAGNTVSTSEGVGLMALHVPPAIVAVLALPDRSPVE